MLRSLSAFTAVALASAIVIPAPAMAQAPQRTKVGTLTCDISAGIGLIITSRKEVTCMFTPSGSERREVYVGSIGKFGLDVGAAAGCSRWHGGDCPLAAAGEACRLGGQGGQEIARWERFVGLDGDSITQNLSAWSRP